MGKAFSYNGSELISVGRYTNMLDCLSVYLPLFMYCNYNMCALEGGWVGTSYFLRMEASPYVLISIDLYINMLCSLFIYLLFIYLFIFYFNL